MVATHPAIAAQIAQAAIEAERRRTGHAPHAVRVVLGGDAIVVTLHGALSPAERALAQTPDGAARVQEFHRQLFASASGPFRDDIHRITGVSVREAAAEVVMATGTVIRVFTTGTMVQVFLLETALPTESWSEGGTA